MRKMKDSGLQWAGDIPQYWNTAKGKYFMAVLERPVRDDDSVITCFRNGEVTLRSNRREDGFTVATVEAGYQGIEPGDLVVHGMDGFAGAIGISDSRGKGTPALNVLSCSENKKYIMYLLRAMAYTEVFMALSTGIRVRTCDTNWKKLKSLDYLIPPADEQQCIADFLDGKCAEIDALAADIQAQIDTLEQYKRSVITETVTKGLNPNAEMKDSGIEGVGKTPSHWKTTRLCYECYIRARLGWRGLKADEYVEEGYAFISAFNIQNGKLVWTPLNYITKERFDESPEIKLQIGDLLIVKDGAGVGKSARVDELPMGGTAPNSSIAVITPSKNQDYRYVCYYLQSAVFNNFVLLLHNGMGVPHLTQEIMNKIKILIPPIKEQMAISDYLDAKCAEIDAAAEAKRQQLTTLDEYKKSLIFEYVTGKKEV